MEKKCYIIAFESDNQTHIGQTIQAIKSYGGWAKITNNTWAITTDQNADQIRTYLSTLLPSGRIFVIKSGYESAWRNVVCSNDWLKNNL